MRYLRYCIETELLGVQDWFNANKLTLNVTKSVYLLFNAHGQKNIEFKLSLNGIEIPCVRYAKLLGTWIVDKLTWEIHANKLLAKLKCGIGMLQRSKHLLTSKARRCLYFGQIHSNLCYCLSIWGTMMQKRSKTLLTNAQRKAVKLIDTSMGIDEVFSHYNILTLEQLTRLEQCKLGYKLCNNLLLTSLSMSMKLDHNNQSIVKSHRYPTRNKSVPNLPTATDSKYCTSFLFKAITEFSGLNAALHDAKTLSAFTKQCKKHLINSNVA